MKKTIVLIPARLSASRLHHKMLLEIKGKTIIRRVYENTKAAFGNDIDIYVAAGAQEVYDECQKWGIPAVLTDPELPSGTDRIAAALKQIDPDGRKYDIVVDFQGDNLNVDPKVCLPLVEMAKRTGCDIATAGTIITSDEDKTNPAIVKIIMGLKPEEDEARCLYFTRATAPFTRNPEKCPCQDLYQHIGIYVFKAESLHRMVALKPGVLEQRESLEQLRALENGMVIRAKLVGDVRINANAPTDVNTPEDFEIFKKWLS